MVVHEKEVFDVNNVNIWSKAAGIRYQQRQVKRKLYKYNHRTSRKGYVNLVEELKASSSEPIDWSLVWKQARLDRKGQIPNKETKEIVDVIDELLATQKINKSSGVDDILTQALDGKDRLGIIRGVGKYVTKKKYFHTARQMRSDEKDGEKAIYEERDRMAQRI